ncbi:ABC transporter ATP-binding protein [Flavobacterium sp.]|uniref:ABC transporter ATP-binding protein n=1 Tax=Flavobacterium sp. TaxID=239 RepID=UPI002FD9BB9C
MLQVQQLQFSYLNQVTLSNLSFELETGQLLAVIGESGCGKSTLLKLIYGLYDADKGHIFWKNQQVLGPKYHLIPGMPYMKYLAQDFDLMPFITVAENVGKYLSNFFPEEKKQRTAELLELVEMSDYAHVKAKFLSGGQMQRVALARVLALEPEVLLLDEPFSHIDSFRKHSLRRKLFAYLKKKQITTLVATHDSTDILSFADEILVLKEGNLWIQGSTKEIYSKPETFYTASLFGEVSKFPSHCFHTEEELFLYPHQLAFSLVGEVQIEVVQSYFRGGYYLVQAQFDSGILYFEHADFLETGTRGYVIQK